MNRDLAYEAAQKAKADGVGQFIFLSTMNVYGMESGHIDEDTLPMPKSHYGRSKLMAEEKITALAGESFRVAVLRPPMVYGKGCKGQLPAAREARRQAALFSLYPQPTDMIYIDNLCEFVRLLIDDGGSGLFFPQNDEYVCTADMVVLIADSHGKKMRLTKVFNPLIRAMKSGTIQKIFGDLVYRQEMSAYAAPYTVAGLEESIKATEI